MQDGPEQHGEDVSLGILTLAGAVPHAVEFVKRRKQQSKEFAFHTRSPSWVKDLVWTQLFESASLTRMAQKALTLRALFAGREMERRAGSPSHEREEGEENMKPLTPALSPQSGERGGGFGGLCGSRGNPTQAQRRRRVGLRSTIQWGWVEKSPLFCSGLCEVIREVEETRAGRS